MYQKYKKYFSLFILRLSKDIFISMYINKYENKNRYLE